MPEAEISVFSVIAVEFVEWVLIDETNYATLHSCRLKGWSEEHEVFHLKSRLGLTNVSPATKQTVRYRYS
jgi:hypothetical protein